MVTCKHREPLLSQPIFVSLLFSALLYTIQRGDFGLLFRPKLITSLISFEDARFGLNASRPSSQTILNGEMRYCLQVTCEQSRFLFYLNHSHTFYYDSTFHFFHYAFSASSFPAAFSSSITSSSGASFAMIPSSRTSTAPAFFIRSAQSLIHSPSPHP